VAALRRTLRAHSWIPLLAFLWGSIVPLSEAHAFGQDDACVLVGASPNGDSTAKVDATSAERGESTHCVICHLIRAMNGVVQPDATLIAAPFVSVPLNARLDAALAALGDSSISSRGPPATL
jgi:hypothetical protein